MFGTIIIECVVYVGLHEYVSEASQEFKHETSPPAQPPRPPITHAHNEEPCQPIYWTL